MGDKRLRTHLSAVFRYFGIQLIKEWVGVVYCWHVKVFVVSHNQCSDLVHKGELNEEVVISKMETTTQHGAVEGKIQFLSFRKYQILTDRGKVSRIRAERKAGKEYEQFNKTQKIESDFDKVIKKLK